MIKKENNYENICLLIQEYEKNALSSNKRVGIIAASHSPLSGMRRVLKSSKSSLSKESKQERIFKVEKEESFGAIPSLPGIEIDSQKLSQQTSLSLIGNSEDSLVNLSKIQFDDDVSKLLGEDNLSDWLRDCLDCDARLSFEWQIQPVDLLGPINDLIDDINGAIAGFKRQMSPFKSIENLCDILNGLSFMCIPDLVNILMSLKMLLQSYMQSQFKLNLDWTVLVGPILKMLTAAISSLINAIGSVMIGPVDCALGAMKSVAELEKASKSVLNNSLALQERIKTRAEQGQDLLQGNEVEIDDSTKITYKNLYKDVAYEETQEGSVSKRTVSLEGNDYEVMNLEPPKTGYIRAELRPEDDPEKNWTEFSFPSGLSLSSEVTLPASLNDPRFTQSHWSTKIIVALQEAQQYILNLVGNVIGSINSLEKLVSGGLTLQLGNLGVLLFIKDQISLIILIIQLFKDHKGVKDWCAYFESNPEILENNLNRLNKNKVNVSSRDKTLVLSRGTEIVGEIKTCKLDIKDPAMLSWIKNLG